MTTFSQLVDSVVIESRRPDMKKSIESYVNQTIRELHIMPNSGAALLYKSNMIELEITADVETGFIWNFPRPQSYQAIQTVFYTGPQKHAIERLPSTIHMFLGEVDGRYYYYRTGDGLAMSGYGGVGGGIKIAYFEFPRRLTYYAVADRPVQWDAETETWVYKDGIVTEAEKLAALQKCTNWMLFRWEDIVKQGAIAKVFTALANYDRARLAYSLYESLRPGLVSAEQYTPPVYQPR